MPRTIKMPALSPTMESGKLAKWLVKEGQDVKTGDIIAEIETDKAIMEIEAPDDGTILKLLMPAGSQDILINASLAHMTGEEDNLDVLSVPSSSMHKKSSSISSDLDQDSHVLSKPTVQKEKPQASLPSVIKHFPVWQGETTIKTVRESIRDVLAQEMRRDKSIFILGEEVGEYQGAYKVTQNLLEEFGSLRVIDTPISEHAFAGMAVGASFAGLHPVVEFMTFNFSMQAMDHLINSAAKTSYMSGGTMSCPIIFRGPNGSSARAGAQHSQDFSSWFAHVPGLVVLAPYDAADAAGLLRGALRSKNPVIFLENEVLYAHRSPVPVDVDYVVLPGLCDVRREGDDCTLVSYGRCMDTALGADDILREKGLSCDVINLRSLRPIDWGTIFTSVRKTKRIVIVEEGWSIGGISAEIASTVTSSCFDDLDSPPKRLCGKDVPMPYADNLEQLALPTVKDVLHAVMSVSYHEIAQ